MRPNNKYAVQMDYTPLWVRILIGVLSFIFGLFFLLNMYIIVNGLLKENGLPSGFGITPVVVVPNENGEVIDDIVAPGDFLLVMERDIQNYERGDEVAFCINGIVLVGRISGQDANVDGKPAYSVRAVFLEQSYAVSATEKNLLGTIAVKIPMLGYFALFLTSLVGRLIFVGIPFLVYLILLIAEFIYIKQTEEREEGERVKERGGVYVQALRDGKARLTAPWIWLMTAVMTWGAIGYGTSEKRRDERIAKKRMAEIALREEPQIQLPKLGARELPVCRPVRMRANRAVRPESRRPAKAMIPKRPRNVRCVDFSDQL